MTDSSKKSRSLAGIAGIVAIATLISKVFGLFREQAIAAVFGVNAVVNAYAYAYVIPGFLLILLGGINGPFHSALVSVLEKRNKSEAAPLVETVTTLVSIALLFITIFLVIFAPNLIDLLAPGLEPITRSLAIEQLRIMSPLALLAGLIGIGFGTLNASDQYWLPSISPLFSSVTVVIGVGLLAWQFGEAINTPQYLKLGGLVLAGGTLLGAVLQWIAQFVTQWKSGMGTLKLRFNWRVSGVVDVLKVMLPATLSSGMLYINVSTDLFFASFIENAAATMRYANFIVLTPVGILSNMILVPFLPVFSRLASPENWPELKMRIRQGMVLTALTMLPLTAVFLALSEPIIRLIYQRGAFTSADSAIVVPVLMAYGIGMFFYLGRDVLVRVFYALGDGETPFRISVLNILLNALLDWILVTSFQTPGIVLATVGVNIISMAIFLSLLHRRLNGLPLKEWGLILLGLIGCSFIAGLASWGVNLGWEAMIGSSNLILQVLQLSVGIGVAFIIFGVLAMQLKLPEFEMLTGRLLKRFVRK